MKQVKYISRWLAAVVQNQGIIYTCGNGGSAAQAMHLTSELMGRYNATRRPIPSSFLGADPCTMTCIGNDFGFPSIFSRTASALMRKDDILVVFSTSGKSLNLLDFSKPIKLRTIFILGPNKGALEHDMSLYNHQFVHLKGASTGAIQESQLKFTHALVEQLEKDLGVWLRGSV
jgi:D-sedoheptulose 7-phosphate isomerase